MPSLSWDRLYYEFHRRLRNQTEYKFWEDIDKKKVKDICTKQTLKYGYEL